MVGAKWAAIVLALAGSCPAVADPNCPKSAGYIPGPFVPDAGTARAIYLAVEMRTAPQRDVNRFPRVVVTDKGDHWAVFRMEKPSKQAGRTFGGGQLELEIDKCTGAISHAAFSK
jgi:hypothetical protein